MIHTLWLYSERVDWSIDCGSNHRFWIDHRLWIDSQIEDWFTYLGLIQIFWIYLWIVEWSTYYGLIHSLWIDQHLVDWSTAWRLINGLWIDPQFLDWSKYCRLIHGLCIDPRLWIDPYIVGWSTGCGLINRLCIVVPHIVEWINKIWIKYWNWYLLNNPKTARFFIIYDGLNIRYFCGRIPPRILARGRF